MATKRKQAELELSSDSNEVCLICKIKQCQTHENTTWHIWIDFSVDLFSNYCRKLTPKQYYSQTEIWDCEIPNDNVDVNYHVQVRPTSYGIGL